MQQHQILNIGVHLSWNPVKFVKAGKVAPCIAFALDRCGLFFFFCRKKNSRRVGCFAFISPHRSILIASHLISMYLWNTILMSLWLEGQPTLCQEKHFEHYHETELLCWTSTALPFAADASGICKLSLCLYLGLSRLSFEYLSLFRAPCLCTDGLHNLVCVVTVCLICSCLFLFCSSFMRATPCPAACSLPG